MEEPKSVLCRVLQRDGSEIPTVCELIVIDSRPHLRLGSETWAADPQRLSPAQGFPGIAYTYQATLVPQRYRQ